MAGDWIKMRGELWTNPRFIALSNVLIYGDKGGENVPFLIYACGEDALNIGVLPPSNENITDRALRCVTKRALRDVTMCALLRVWTAVNAHGKVSGNDAICQPMDLCDLDEIAGFDGFGDALEIVGWVFRDEDSDSLIFKNFLDHNEPACLRAKPMTNAERQAKYRREHGGENKPKKKRVTESNESNAREEKRREENINTSKRAASAPVIRPDSVTEEVWNDFLQVRKAKRSPITETALRGIEVQAKKAGVSLQAALEICCKRGWQGFEAAWVTDGTQSTRQDGLAL